MVNVETGNIFKNPLNATDELLRLQVQVQVQVQDLQCYRPVNDELY